MYQLEVIGVRIADARWQTWPAAERRALIRVLHRWWQVALLTETDIQQLRDLLDLLVTVTHTLGPWLRRWSSTTGPGPDRLLVAFADRVLPDALAGSCRLGFYDDYDGTRELTAWLLDHAWLRVGVRPDGARLDEAFTMLITYPPEQDAEASRRSESRSPTGALCTGHRVRMPISRPQWTVTEARCSRLPKRWRTRRWSTRAATRSARPTAWS
jgi:hypothetical protein